MVHQRAAHRVCLAINVVTFQVRICDEPVEHYELSDVGARRLIVPRVVFWFIFFFQAEDGIRDIGVTGVQTCALPISSSFERATMQLRMSPGGRMRFSRRKRPELPPSSVTVTMAARSAMGRSVLARSSVRRMTSSLRPRRSVERPVPPPRATTRKPRDRVFGLELRFVMRAFGMAEQGSFYRKEFNTENSEDTESTEKKKTGQAEACPKKTANPRCRLSPDRGAR